MNSNPGKQSTNLTMVWVLYWCSDPTRGGGQRFNTIRAGGLCHDRVMWGWVDAGSPRPGQRCTCPVCPVADSLPSVRYHGSAPAKSEPLQRDSTKPFPQKLGQQAIITGNSHRQLYAFRRYQAMGWQRMPALTVTVELDDK